MTAIEGIAQMNTLATHTALSVWAFANDFLIVLVLFSIFFLFAWYVGRGPFTALLLALYSAYAPFALFPYASLLPNTPPLTAFLAHVGLYAAFVVIFFIILRRVVVSNFLYIGALGLVVLALLAAVFLIVLATHLFAATSFYHFTPIVSSIFLPDKYFFWWFVAPLAGLFIFAR